MQSKTAPEAFSFFDISENSTIASRFSASPVFARSFTDIGRKVAIDQNSISNTKIFRVGWRRFGTTDSSPKSLHMFRSIRQTDPAFAAISLIRYDMVQTISSTVLVASRFDPLGSTSSRNSRCTFLFRGFAQYYPSLGFH